MANVFGINISDALTRYNGSSYDYSYDSFQNPFSYGNVISSFTSHVNDAAYSFFVLNNITNIISFVADSPPPSFKNLQYIFWSTTVRL